MYDTAPKSPPQEPGMFMPAGQRIDAPLSTGSAAGDERYVRNLIIVHTPGAQDVSDFLKVKQLIAERAPEIEVFLVANDAPQSVTRKKASGRPTLIFSPYYLQSFQPARGKIYAGRILTKLRQVRMLEDAGIPVPKAFFLNEDTKLDRAKWGDYVILKPNVGSRGSGVRLSPFGRIFDNARELGWPQTAYLVQKFIDTGPYPTEYRALTVFGEPVYCNRVTSQEKRPDLTPDMPMDGRIASNSGPRASTPCYDEDVLDLARRTFHAFPQVPVQGMDIIRDVHTGELHVLEVNPGGATWHLSSQLGKRLQERNGYSYYEQFDAISVIADRLIHVTRREAE
ncbi:MAG TPA: ATP-grasp domain-containing protein [Phycisphaerae bacterium]|nr:ATP-grasp domain-containing protein [Phycisphaerae bacterium]